MYGLLYRKVLEMILRSQMRKDNFVYCGYGFILMSHICDIILWLRFILVYSLVLITLYIDAIISIL